MPAVECATISQGLLTNPIGFLTQNVVLVGLPPEDLPPHQLRLFDADVEVAQALLPNGNPAGGLVYSLFPSATGHLIAHYLPWQADTGFHVSLSHQSPFRLMFTATLSGCAVGYVRAPDGSARVSHHNIQHPVHGTDGGAQQASLGFAGAAIHRQNYRVGGAIPGHGTFEGFAHVHGIRPDNGGWRFIAQVVRKYASFNTGNQAYVIGDVGELQ